MIPEHESAEQMRARWRQWAAEETDPYYRRQFMLASLTPRQRLARWWSINWPILITLLVLAGVALALLAWVAVT